MPVLLRNHFVRTEGSVPVRVDETRQDGFARGVDRPGVGGDGDLALPSDRLDAVALDQDDAVLDDLVALHGDDAASGEGDHVGGGRRVDWRVEADVDALRRRLGQLLGRAGKKRERVLQVPLVELRPVGPVEARGVAREVEELAGVLRHARHRNGLALGTDVDAAAGLDERRDVGVEALAEGEPLAVGRHLELLGDLGEVVLVLVRAVELDGGQDALGGSLLVASALGLDEEDAVVVLAEEGRGALAGDERRLAAGRRRPVDAGLIGPGGRTQVPARVLAVDDPRAVGRESGLHVMARLVRHDARHARRDCGDADRPERLVVPARVDDRLRIARPRREELEVVGLLRQTPGRAARQVLDVDVAQGRVSDALAVGRDADPAEHADGEGAPHPGPLLLAKHHLACRDVDGPAHGGRRLAGVLDVKGNFGNLLARDVDAADLAACPQNHRLSVRRPRDAGVDTVNGPGLLHVALEAVPDGALDAGLEVLDEERRLVAHAPHEGDRLAVWRRRRADRPARARDEIDQAAGLAVEALDDVDLAVGVGVVLEGFSGRGVLGVIEVAPVGREGGLARVLLFVGALGHLEALAPRAVVEPDFAGAQGARAGEVLARRDVLRVGRPGR